MKAPVELAVFDLSGTTVADGDAVNRALRGALEAAGLAVAPSDADAVMGLPKPVALELLIRRRAGQRAEPLLARLREIHADFEERMVRAYSEDPDLAEIPGVSEVFRVLRAHGIKIAYNTGFGRGIAQVLLDRMGWLRLGLIDQGITSDEVPRGRPYADMIISLMSSLRIAEAKRVIKIGDTPADLEEGTNAGCGMVVGVLTGSHTRDQLLRYPHSLLLESVRELPGALELTERLPR